MIRTHLLVRRAWLDEVTTDADPDDGGWHSLLIRRNIITGELAFYRCWSPQPATLAQLGRVAGIRWTVEEAVQAAKSQVGLDQHQVRRWHLLASLHHARVGRLTVLAICAADAREPHAGRNEPTDAELIGLTVNEVRRLINALILRPIRDLAHRLQWSLARPAPGLRPTIPLQTTPQPRTPAMISNGGCRTRTGAQAGCARSHSRDDLGSAV